MPSTNDPIISTTRTGLPSCEASAAALLRRASVENSLLRRELAHCESHAEYGSLSQAGRRVLAALLPPARGVESEARKLREELLQAQETAAALLEQVHAAQRAPEGDGPLAHPRSMQKLLMLLYSCGHVIAQGSLRFRSPFTMRQHGRLSFRLPR